MEPSTDATAIRKAYAVRLKAIKRDLDPHAFQELRAAYEWALGQADGDGSLAPSPAPPPPPREPLTKYGSATPAPPVIVTTGPEPAPRRQRWKDLVGPPGEAPAPGQRRKRDSAAAPASGPDERARVEQALAEVREAFLHSDATQATAAFVAIHARISHPVTGVSIAALAAFERELLRLVAAPDAQGESVAAVAREASRLMGWAERARDVNGDLDPLAGSLAGFLTAEEIARCARGEAIHHSPIPREFAQDLTGPFDQVEFARKLTSRARFAARKAQFAELAQMPGSPLNWLPPANVEWWRNCVKQPRFFLAQWFKWLAFFCVSAVPFAAALLGKTIEPVLVVVVVVFLLQIFTLPIVAVRQDFAWLAFLKPVWRALDRFDAFLDRSRRVPGGELNVGGHLVAPIVFAMFAAGLPETLKEAAKIKPPLGLLQDFGEWLLVAWVYLALRMGYQFVAHWVSGWKRTGWSYAATIVGAMVGIPVFVGMMASFNGQDVLGSMKAAGVVVLVIAGIGGAIYGVRALVAKIPESLRAAAWGVLAVLGLPLLMMATSVREDGFMAALEGAGFVAAALAGAVVPIVALVYMARHASRVEILTERGQRARFPRLFALGLRPANWLKALLAGGLVGSVMVVDSSQGTGEALIGGVIVGGPVFLMALFFFATRDRQP